VPWGETPLYPNTSLTHPSLSHTPPSLSVTPLTLTPLSHTPRALSLTPIYPVFGAERFWQVELFEEINKMQALATSPELFLFFITLEPRVE